MWKELIEQLDCCAEKVIRLTGKSNLLVPSDKTKFLFIEQEVEAVCPELIIEDEQGLSIDTPRIITLFVEALKNIDEAASKEATGRPSSRSHRMLGTRAEHHQGHLGTYRGRDDGRRPDVRPAT